MPVSHKADSGSTECYEITTQVQNANDTFVKGKSYCDLLAFFHAKKESDYFPGLRLKKQ